MTSMKGNQKAGLLSDFGAKDVCLPPLNEVNRDMFSNVELRCRGCHINGCRAWFKSCNSTVFQCVKWKSDLCHQYKV